MTEIEQKALALVNEVTFGDEPWTLDDVRGGFVFKALCRAIEQHEAFKREVSKAITDLTYQQHQYTFTRGEILGHLEKFVLKEPVDPLVEVLAANWETATQVDADYIRAALAKRGLEVREIEG